MSTIAQREAALSAQAAALLAGPKELPYWVAFYERDAPHKRFDARLSDSPPTPGTAGGGGGTGDWTVVTLPKRSAVTVWTGRLSLKLMSIPIVWGDMSGQPLYPGGNALEKMHRPDDPTQEPPVVKVRSPGSAVPFQNLDYVVTDLAWGEMRAGPNGNRLIQKMVVTLLEYRPDEVLQNEAAAKPKHRGRTYTVKAGDTLSGIAKRFGVKGGWQAIGKLQHPPIRDPRSIKVGQRLLIP